MLLNHKSIRIIKHFVIIVFAVLISFSAFYTLWLSPKYTVPILMYHRFGYKEDNLFVTPENLERQTKYLKDKKYNIIKLDELIDGIKSGRKFKHNTVVITIDDGYQDNYSSGYPIFKKYDIPVTIFLVANQIGNDKLFLNWDEVRAMLNNGVSFGGHTKNHAYLPLTEDKDAVWDEIKGCKDIIERNIGSHINHFCYPGGGFNNTIKELVVKAGYVSVCTTNRGSSKLNLDVYELKRIKVKNTDTNEPFSFAAKLSGYYNLFRSIKEGH
ncbi:MAG: polysaccharide deacetylase family protein [Candidatus Omnitrophota bacterium]|nr:polysaccharide deacetylase family protein [Candidatus Omnitrophota bacterium]